MADIPGVTKDAIKLQVRRYCDAILVPAAASRKDTGSCQCIAVQQSCSIGVGFG
jgi:hypothetical protein